MAIVELKIGHFFYQPGDDVYYPSKNEYKNPIKVGLQGVASKIDIENPLYNPIPTHLKDRIDRVLITRGCIEQRVEELAREISKDYREKGVDKIYIACILRGAVYFTADLTRKLDPNITQVLDFIVASSYGLVEESQGIIKIIKDLAENIKGQHLLIVEDIVDTGFTYSVLEELVRISKKPKSIKLVALCDKPSRREKELEYVNAHYIGFVIPNVYVVGYGLDSGNAHRNLPFIVAFKPTPEELAREEDINHILNFEIGKGIIDPSATDIRRKELSLKPDLVEQLFKYINTFSK